MVAVVLLVVFSRSGWHSDWLRALSWANGSTLLLSPLLAGAVAFTVWRQYSRDLQALTATTLRGARTVLHLTLALWLYAVAAWALGVAAVVGRTWLAGTTGATPDAWTLVTGPGALLAAAGVGAVVGVVVRHLAAAPLAVLFVYLAPLPAGPMAYPEVLFIPGATGSLTGFRPILSLEYATIAANALIAVAAVYLTWRLTRVRTRDFILPDLIGLAAVIGLVLVFAPFVRSGQVDTYYEVTTARCLAQAVAPYP